MYCPKCKKTKLKVIDSRHSMYVGKSVCGSIALDIGGDNAIGRVRHCPKCDAKYYSVETLEIEKKPKKDQWI